MIIRQIMRTELLENSCELCAGTLHGIVLPADDPRWQGYLGQPAHPNCTYLLVPLFEGIDPVMEPTPESEIPLLSQLQYRLFTEEAIMADIFGGAERIAEITEDDIRDIITNEDILNLLR